MNRPAHANGLKGCVKLKPYEKQELEACGFFSRLFGDKPAENAWKELNNLLADADSVLDLNEEQVRGALKKWGVKYNEENYKERSGIYRKLADVLYSVAESKDDPLFAQCRKLAELLELPPHLVKLADKGAKTTAYFSRCEKILKKEEALDINAVNKLFGYDYEDGLSIRKQVFHNYFNLKFDEISKAERFSPEDEEHLRNCCAALDIPYEFKNNITNAMAKYRDLWNAEHMELSNLPIALPLNEGEICHAYTNCGLCQHKVVETEDNYYELTRKFRIDETVSFKGEEIEYPKIKEEITALLELGTFFLTNQRIIYFSNKKAFGVDLKDLEDATFDGINMVTYHRKEQGGDELLFKYSDEAAGVMYILFKRALANAQAEPAKAQPAEAQTTEAQPAETKPAEAQPAKTQTTETQAQAE